MQEIKRKEEKEQEQEEENKRQQESPSVGWLAGGAFLKIKVSN